MASKRKFVEPSSLTNKRSRTLAQCSICGLRGQANNVARHMKRKHQSNMSCYDCTECDYQGCKDLDYLKVHYDKQHTGKNFKCSKCGWQFTKEGYFGDDHLENCIKYCPSSNQSIPSGPLEPIDKTAIDFERDPEEEPDNDHPMWRVSAIMAEMPEVEELLRHHWIDFRQQFITGSNVTQRFNFRTVGDDTKHFNLTEALKFVYSKVNVTFNFNIGATVLLKREKENEPVEYRVFVAQRNMNNLLPRNLNVHNPSSFKVALEKVETLGNLTEKIEWPSTEWQYVATLGLCIFTYLRPNFVAGCKYGRLPEYVSRNRNITAMEQDKNRHYYNDNLCFFRSLLAFQQKDPNDKRILYQTYEIYKSQTNGPPMEEFKGLPEKHIPLVEQLFGINVQIYRMDARKNITCLKKAPPDDGRPTMNLHSYPINESQVHFSLIINLINFAGKHQCENCGRMFKLKEQLKKHSDGHCRNGEPTYFYPGGCYEASKTIFDHLLEFGIVVEPERQCCKSMAVWDCEAVLESYQKTYHRTKEDKTIEERLNKQNIKVEYVEETKRLQKRERHMVITSAIKSTIPTAQDTKFFFNPDPEKLMEEIYSTMVELSNINYEQQKQLFKSEFEKLQELKGKAECIIKATKDNSECKRERSAIQKLDRLENWLERYCRQLTILTFNGGRYDLNLVKKYLYPKMVASVRVNKEDNDGDKDTSWPRAITRGSTVLCLSTKELRFIDIMLYLAPGVNLDKFIKTFNPGGQTKAFFPYELLRAPEDLINITEFPPKEAFYSTLKNSTITDEDYGEAKKMWDALEEKTLLAFMKEYNTRDVEPFLEGCKNMASTYWADFGIDIYKQAQSIPGVCLAYLFKELHKQHPTTHFGLFDKSTSQLSEELYDSICGGLSVIVQRIAEAGKTPIRGNPEKLVKKVVGFDFNALYLWALMQDTPTGYPDHFKLNHDAGKFERKSITREAMLKKRKCHGEVDFLKFNAYSDKLYIHTAEHGQQTSLGIHQYRVDGFAKDASPRPRVYQYHGCKYHHHKEGCLNKNLNLENDDISVVERDAKMKKDLEDLGLDVIIMWECQWQQIKKIATDLRSNRKPRSDNIYELEVAKRYNDYLRAHPKRKFHSKDIVDEKQMVKEILDGNVFGFVKVDLSTKEEFRELYEDFPPIVKHAMISRDDHPWPLHERGGREERSIRQAQRRFDWKLLVQRSMDYDSSATILPGPWSKD